MIRDIQSVANFIKAAPAPYVVIDCGHIEIFQSKEAMKGDESMEVSNWQLIQALALISGVNVEHA